MKRFYSALVTLVAVAILVPAPSFAVPVFVADRTSLGANDFIDWGVLGPDLTIVADPFNIASDGGTVTANVSNPSGDFQLRKQSSSWFGNFAPGDNVLFTNFSPGPIVIEFADPVFGAGAQIQQNLLQPFVGHLDVYDVNNVLIGSFALPGISNSNADNSAIFLGVLDSSPTIKRIAFYDSLQGTGINRLSLVSQVPEPSTLLLLGVGLVGVAGAAWRRRLS